MSDNLYQRYLQYLCECPTLGLTLDISRMRFSEGYFEQMAPLMQRAYAAMESLEAGAIANPDEKRMVGHYWLRNPDLAPLPGIAHEIRQALNSIRDFADRILTGHIKPPTGDRFTDVLVIGIGGSALGPQFVADALGDTATDKMSVHFLDNTDPDGIARTLRRIGGRITSTLSIMISKSGGTPETRNGMLLAAEAYRRAGLNFAMHAVAITGEGSKLDRTATDENWLLRLPMWDWVGGRTSELSPVGLLPAALQGLDIQGMLQGAADCDATTRRRETLTNPAALLALMWHHATNGRGEKDMVVLPYKDRLLLFSRYLQQLVMESLGKADDLDGRRVEQGIAVYGNKGSTDQHAYVQQLREGVNNFFATFIRVLEDGGSRLEVDRGVTCGDYLDGFWLGTRQALYENGRESITLTVPRVDAYRIGVLIALFERAVGYYGYLVNINAYHQPGVEAGKKAATAILELQSKIVVRCDPSTFMAFARNPLETAQELARELQVPDQSENVLHILEHLSANRKTSS